MRPPGASQRARRSPRLVVIGVLCSVLGALVIAAAFAQTRDTRSVVVMSRTVERGEILKPGDLTTVSIGAAPGLATVPADQLDSLIGKSALVDLPAAALVGREMVGEPVLAKDTSHLGVKLEAGRLPLGRMPAGTRVLLVEVSAAQGQANVTSAAARTFPATVVTSPTELPDGATWVLDVAVTSRDAAQVAELAATGRLVVVRTS